MRGFHSLSPLCSYSAEHFQPVLHFACSVLGLLGLSAVSFSCSSFRVPLLYNDNLVLVYRIIELASWNFVTEPQKQARFVWLII